ncbi:GatB/YqeY domain-containing protein [Secundilactobacillus malefermentans]|uniref:GatB/YqeY domain-containing protein n=1 Tax=Secundilactobacillus malefermentans TaxID=176292 RepID=A0A4R5NNN6_9LACO|nr:GatB/YqeY domain-containing protein [Secundilactobacillus malefermentans]KRM59414.1 GatB YqeY domain-containing protein [Secundilactobacillus malefermentans DSM 5705 = KCTC 3548]QEA32305.1 GatB/YqeY domain-containing protein [Secundilactobacillus malefermentans]TDG78061.1 hypothetical protein C5L31_001296 [Secundilactobacillus malefermentans]
MGLQDQLTADLKVAMKARDKMSLNVIRSIKTALTNDRVKLEHDLTEEEETAVVSREMKQRKESLVEFENAGRDDLSEPLKEEIKIVAKYAPEQMSQDEVEKIVKQAISDTGASSMGDFGKVMGKVMGQVKGKADGNVVNQTVKSLLK